MSVVPDDVMQQIHDVSRTPFKYGIVLRPPTNGLVDCPSIFRRDGRWWMLYVQAIDKIGYETCLAASDDLLAWTPLGKVLGFGAAGAWDQWQADGGAALVDPTWGGSSELGTHEGKCWMTYIGGAQQGYEPDPLSIGVAWTTTPTEPRAWNRGTHNPVLGPSDPHVRPFEAKTLYKSTVLRDDTRVLGGRFVMFYNGKQQGRLATERIGMALSDDLLHWRRFGDGPVIDNGERGISGDPQIVRMNDVWVMHYFGHVWKPRAFDTFAASYDLVNWTRWQGPHLVEPSEPWDDTFAHKPWVLKWDGVVYHFYCAVGKEGRCIALATSRDLRR